MPSKTDLLRAWINRRRSIEMGLAEAAKRRVWRPHTKEQASRPISESSNLQPYIVRVGAPPSSSDLLSYYQTFLPKTAADEESRIIRASDNVRGCFVARLSPEEVKAMEKIPGFIYARAPAVIFLCSTQSNQNMGFLKDSNYGKGVIMSGWKSK